MRKNKLMMPTDKENKEINLGIKKDSDTKAWTKKDFAKAKPASEILPKVVSQYRKTRGAQKAPTKIQKTLRLSPEVIEYFSSTGKGWQTRIDDVLKEYVAKQ